MQLQYVYLIVSNMGAPTQEDSLLILKNILLLCRGFKQD